LGTYIIPDTHGCLITLKCLLEEKIGISKDDHIYFLGDYIDRGLFSAQLVDYIINLKESGYHIHTIRGNHEQMLLDAIGNSSALNDWILNTGNLTLNSYKDFIGDSFLFPQGIPQKHLNFYNELPYYLLVDKYILVHGALNYKLSNPFSDKLTMLWNRSEAVPYDFMPDKVIIHGHTPVPLEYIKRTVSNSNSRLISLDGGCVYHGKIYGAGYLVALELESMKLFWVEKMEGRS
jgi:serine/threonine protein phosphatase 1